MNTKYLKTVNRFAFVIIITVSLYSCCKTIECSPWFADEIKTVGFSRQEAEFFYIKKFRQNSNFIQALDSMMLGQPANIKLENNGSDTTRITLIQVGLKFPIEEGYDFEIFFPNGNTVRRLTEIKESRSSQKFCNTGFAKNVCYNSLSSLKIDGVNATSIILRK